MTNDTFTDDLHFNSEYTLPPVDTPLVLRLHETFAGHRYLKVIRKEWVESKDATPVYVALEDVEGRGIEKGDHIRCKLPWTYP